MISSGNKDHYGRRAYAILSSKQKRNGTRIANKEVVPLLETKGGMRRLPGCRQPFSPASQAPSKEASIMHFPSYSWRNKTHKLLQ
jgi:hypothetical protein